MVFASWQPATRCVGSARPGARALMAFLLATHPKASSAGIYSCRNVRGGSSTSCHAEGRALDVHFPGHANPAGAELVQQLRPIAAQLGIQAIIFNRTIWSAKSPGKAGRRYTGANPHYDHVHIELTRSAAEKLTKATIKAVLGGSAKPAPKPVAKLGSRTLRKGSAGADVTALQKFLGVNADSTFGDGTDKALRAWQKKHHLTADGVAGVLTLAAILKELKT